MAISNGRYFFLVFYAWVEKAVQFLSWNPRLFIQPNSPGDNQPQMAYSPDETFKEKPFQLEIPVNSTLIFSLEDFTIKGYSGLLSIQNFFRPFAETTYNTSTSL